MVNIPTLLQVVLILLAIAVCYVSFWILVVLLVGYFLYQGLSLSKSKE